MSGYQRFITYLFYYEKNSRKENCGFAKIERRQNTCRMEIHVKKIPRDHLKTDVCFYFREGDGLFSVPIGQLFVKKHMLDGVFRFDARAIGETAIPFEQIRGIVIPVEKDCVIASQWDDEATDWSRLDLKSEREEASKDLKEYEKESEQLAIDSDIEEDTSEHILNAEEELSSEEPVEQAEDLEKQSIQQMSEEAPVAVIREQQDTAQETGIFSAVWKYLKEQYEELDVPNGKRNMRAVRIELKDFRYFPKCFWHLRSSRFLLHGYFNYGKLLFGYVEETNRWFIGVPGVYADREQELAVVFGFPDFWTETDEQNKQGETGYWIRYLTA